MNKILITGITGFLGSHLAKFLVKSGNKVYGTIRNTSDTFRLKSVIDQIKLFNVDQIAVNKIFYDLTRIDVVINTANLYGKNNENITDVLDANLLFPVKVLEASYKKNTKLFINTDTYFSKSNFNCKYLQEYVTTKKQFVVLGKLLSDKYKKKFVNMRLEHIYGPFDQTDKFVSIITDSLLKNISHLNLTNGEQLRDFIYVDDVLEAYLSVLKHDISKFMAFTEFEVGVGNIVSIKDFVQKVKNLTGASTQLNFGSLSYRIDEIMKSCADTTNLKKLSWFPKISVDEGIQRLIKITQNCVTK